VHQEIVEEAGPGWCRRRSGLRARAATIVDVESEEGGVSRMTDNKVT